MSKVCCGLQKEMLGDRCGCWWNFKMVGEKNRRNVNERKGYPVEDLTYNEKTQWPTPAYVYY